MLLPIIFGGDRVIYKNIVARCEAAGLSISRLERETGLSNATIRGWAESSPTVHNLAKVADRLGCTVDDLLKED